MNYKEGSKRMKIGARRKRGQCFFSNLLNTIFRISRIIDISFMLRVLKKAVNLDSSLSKAWFLDERNTISFSSDNFSQFV